MIDISKLEKSSLKTNVPTSNDIFDELGNNTYDYKDLISELIDNSVAARKQGTRLKVTIDLYVDDDNNPIEFCIKDNASGIPQEKFGRSITPAGFRNVDKLNEHGLGMKQAVAALGKLKYLATKTEEETKVKVVLEFKYGDLDTYSLDKFEYNSGTEIVVNNLKAIVVINPTSITRSLIPYLGARYRRFLKPDKKEMNLTLNIKKISGEEIIYDWEVLEVKPIYFHPSTRTNKPVISKYKLSGTNWKAELIFGYAPQDKEEYDELGVDIPGKFHPYNVSLSKQGFDIIRSDRVVLFHQLSELEIVSGKHNDYNIIRGEIDLKEGFRTAITKNSIIYDNNFKECIDKITDILTGELEIDGEKKKYLKLKTYPSQIPEALLRDRLATWLQNNPLQKRKNVQKEYVIEGIEGYIDIFADKEAWELKVEQAGAKEVYQLFMYMDVGNIKKGYLLAQNFTTGAEVAKNHVNEKHKKEIILTKLDQFPIIHPPTKSEREDYY